MNNLYTQLIAIHPQPHRAVAKLTVKKAQGYLAQTTAGKQPIALKGNGYEIGQTVFYDTQTAQILETAPDLSVIDIPV